MRFIANTVPVKGIIHDKCWKSTIKTDEERKCIE